MSSSSSTSSSSSSSSSSSLSPSSSSTPHDTSNVAPDIPGPSTRRTAEFEGPSSSRRRAMNEVWPEFVLETLAPRVAIDAANYDGRLAAASALAIMFQVCSTWRALSSSDPLWEYLTRQIWRRTCRLRPTWHQEYIYWHRTARNFTTGTNSFFIPRFDPSDAGDHHICRCLTLSDRYLACGFSDGTVRLFDLDTRVHVSTFRSIYVHRFGPFSLSVSGIVITNSVLTFARLDGDVYVAIINGSTTTRRAIAGDVVNNGVLVEFAGCSHWWVGLFAGLPGRAFQIWNAHTEQRVFVGGSLTDPETVMGWHMLTELVEPVGRVRVTEQEFVVACTSSRLVCFYLWNPEVLLRDVGSTTGFVVTSLDVSHEAFGIVERNGVGTVRRASTLERLSRFRLRVSWLRGLLGCMNLGYYITYSGGSGVLRVWDIEHPVGQLRVRVAVRAGDGNSMVGNQRHVAISWNDTSILLLDFGVQED
ncbi:transcriptional regulator STERILE APETALA [Gastrolobium bilobum]|uniref:transcriptional regulator STERILE APETALA n=1 Tax=Gastrolobium bilobum TaxID=150636 RepID=UPI002AB0BF45|nr:transcriptional regulator STERILE APETALA [Gastrolobium bilobum]